MLKKILKNTRNPHGLWGKIILCSMNIGHGPMARWGLNAIHFAPDEYILDVGCGGGKNIQRILKRAPLGRVCGVDYSALSVEKSLRLNKRAVLQGCAEVALGAVSKLPFESSAFDTVTAFETVYFWPDIAGDMKEICRVLKPGGRFFICNEAVHEKSYPDKYDYIVKAIGMKVYSEEELTTALEGAGYIQIKVLRHRTRALICFVAYKPEGDEQT